MTKQIPEEGYYVDDDGQLHIFVRGVPFGGPAYLDEKDFSGEYFSEKTDLGPLQQALTFFEHGKLGMKVPVDHPAREVLDKFSKTCIGVSEKVMTDEEGVIYEVLVDRNYRYQNLLLRLAQEKMFKASTTPFQRTVEIDKTTGHIDVWHVVENTLTVNPDNPLAEQVYAKVLKELGEEMLMAQKKVQNEKPTPMPSEAVLEKTQPVDPPTTPPANVPDPVDPPAPETPPAPASEPNTQGQNAPVVPATEEEDKEEEKQEEKTAQQKLDEAFANANKPQEEKDREEAEKALSTGDLSRLLALFDSLSLNLNGWASVEKTISAQNEKIVKLQTELEQIYTLFPVLADKIAEKVTEKLEVDLDKTGDIRTAEKTARKRLERLGNDGKESGPRKPVSDLPENAPR